MVLNVLSYWDMSSPKHLIAFFLLFCHSIDIFSVKGKTRGGDFNFKFFYFFS